MSLATIESVVIKRASLPANFSFYKWEWVGENWSHLKVTGMVAPKLESGERAWKYGDKATKKVFKFSKQQLDEIDREWEAEHQKCHGCAGKGEESASWSKDNGTTMRQCSKCKGTGLPSKPLQESIFNA